MTNNMLSIPELAAESNESAAVWRKRIERREIAFVKLGRNVRVRREDYIQYVAARVVEPENQQCLLASEMRAPILTSLHSE